MMKEIAEKIMEVLILICAMVAVTCLLALLVYVTGGLINMWKLP